MLTYEDVVTMWEDRFNADYAFEDSSSGWLNQLGSILSPYWVAILF